MSAMVVATEERKKHVQELRKAHFNFGFEKQVNYNTVKHDPLPVTKSSKVRPMSSVVQNEIPVPQLTQHEIKAGLQKNNYRQGNENTPNMYDSIHQTSYVRPQTGIPRAKLSDDTKNDLRRHHFQLGFHQVDAPTEYKQKYLGQSASSNSHLGQVNKETLRKHNHDFGDDQSYYSTIYDQMHNRQYDTSLMGQSKTKAELTDHIVQIRKTNLVMGRDQTQYTSQSQAVHNSQPMTGNFMNSSDAQGLIKNSHIQVGTDAPQYQSEAKGRFQGKQNDQRTNLEEERRKDLRATHFKVGNDSKQYQTTAQAFYKEPPVNDYRPTQNKEIQKTHFKIEESSTIYRPEEHYQSAYNQQFKGTSNKIINGMPDRSKNVKLGDDVDHNRFTSEAAHNFIDHKAPPARLSDDVQKDLRSHHYQFGDDKRDFVSQFKGSHSNGVGIPARLDDDLKKDLRAHHFRFGFSQPSYITHHQEIGSKQGPANALDPEVARKLKAHTQHLD